MAADVTNLVLGPAEIYAAPVGTSETGVTSVSSLSAAPTGDWVSLGGTTDGVTLTITNEWAELSVDQVVDLAGSRVTSRRFTIGTNLAELTLDNLKVALNGGTITSGGGVDSYEPETGNSGAEPNYSALLIDGWAPNGNRRRIIIRKALQTGDVEFVYSKEDQSVYSVEFQAHYVSSSVAPFRIVNATPAS